MLVLTRKKGQSINIGNNIRVVVVDVTGDTIRLGIEAPADIAVYRSEIYLAIQKENREAVASSNLLAEIKAISLKGKPKKI
jgi:carbon storage regulator